MTVQRLGGVGGAVSVDYQTSDGSATAGSDYAATSGTLNWAAGDSADKTFTVPVNWDGRAEGTESISLTLTNPGGGADLGPNTAAVIRIGDDGASGPLALSSNAYSVGEADGVVTITATRSGGSLGGPVSVDYATSDGTATAGSDYAAAAARSRSVRARRQELHRPRDERLRARRRRDVPGDALERRRRREPRLPGRRHRDDRRRRRGARRTGNIVPGSGSRPTATRAPKLTLAAKRMQRALKAKRLTLSARCNERCKLAAVAKVRIGKQERRPGPREGDRALRQGRQDQAQALEEGAGQAAQGDEARKGQGRPLRHAPRTPPATGRRVPQGACEALTGSGPRVSQRGAEEQPLVARCAWSWAAPPAAAAIWCRSTRRPATPRWMPRR